MGAHLLVEVMIWGKKNNMLITAILNLLSAIFKAMFFFLPAVNTLPTIAGYDIDTALVTGVGQAYQFATYIWPIYDVLIGAMFIWTFHIGMLFLRLLLGHRAPR